MHDPYSGKKLKRSQRAEVFAAWLLAKFGAQNCILDVAGGKGELARQMLLLGVCKEVVLVDPRCSVRAQAGLIHRKERFGADWDAGERRIDLVVGMHIDEVTEPSIEWFDNTHVELFF